jgi:ADP-heptose:LPS heptosyltransferase
LKLTLKKIRAVDSTRQIIAVSQVVHLGDIIACEPVVRQVRSDYPEAFIIFALHQKYRALADEHQDIDYVIPLNCVSEWARFARSGLFDCILDLNIYGRTCEICGVPWRKPDGNNGITSDNYYKYGNLLEVYCRSAGCVVPQFGPRFVSSGESIRSVDNIHLEIPFVVLHATSNERDREVPLITWKRIVEHINKFWGVPVVEVGLKAVAVSCHDTFNRSLCGQLTIQQSAEVIRRSVLFLGSDSGPAHIANAVGAYAIIALGYYRGFKRYMPYSGDYAKGIRSEIIYHEGPVASISAMRIIQAIDKRLTAVLGNVGTVRQ